MARTHKRKLTEDEINSLKMELSTIKRRNLSKMRELTQKAYEALVEIEEIEKKMDEEGEEINENYTEVNFKDEFKLTFAKWYKKDLDESESNDPSLEACRFFVQEMHTNAEEMAKEKESKEPLN
jgi:hypothetical protein